MVMMPGDDVLMLPAGRRIEVFTGAGRRRRWSAGAKAQIVAESYATWESPQHILLRPYTFQALRGSR